jgi:mercuric ion transport protein
MIRDKADPAEVLRLETERPSAQDRAGLVAAGGVAGAKAASACRILPLVLFCLGVGGVGVGRLSAPSRRPPC